MTLRSHHEPGDSSARVNGLPAEPERDGQLLATRGIRRDGGVPEPVQMTAARFLRFGC